MSWLHREPLDYPRYACSLREHHRRYRAYVEAHGFTCQECGGAGGEVDIVCDGQGPWDPCGFCEGTGLVTRWIRGRWLTWKRQERKGRERRQAARKAKAA